MDCRADVIQRLQELNNTHCEKLHKALFFLNETERAIIERYYIDPERVNIMALAVELHYDQRTIKRKKEAALDKLIVELHG